MAGNFCTYCGNAISPMAVACPQCGHPVAANAEAASTTPSAPAAAPIANGPIKSKLAAGLFAILLGGIGVHKFYLGRIGLGIVYALFWWTWIPSIIGLIEGILYLSQSDEEFSQKNGVRVA